MVDDGANRSSKRVFDGLTEINYGTRRWSPRGGRSETSRALKHALRPSPYLAKNKPSSHLLLVPSLLPQYLNPSHNLFDPLLRPPVCCGRSSSIVVLSSRACLLLDALCLSEALVSFRRQKAPERRFSCRLAWAVCLRSLLRAISDMRVSVRLLLKDLSGRGQSRVRYVLFAFPPLRAYGPAPQTSPYL